MRDEAHRCHWLRPGTIFGATIHPALRVPRSTGVFFGVFFLPFQPKALRNNREVDVARLISKHGRCCDEYLEDFQIPLALVFQAQASCHATHGTHVSCICILLLSACVQTMYRSIFSKLFWKVSREIRSLTKQKYGKVSLQECLGAQLQIALCHL